MNRNDLKNYKHTEEWIKGRIEYIEQYKSNINRLNSILSDMPKGSKEVQDSETEKIAELLDSVDELLEKVKEKKQTTNEDITTVGKSRTALQKYIRQMLHTK